MICAQHTISCISQIWICFCKTCRIRCTEKALFSYPSHNNYPKVRTLSDSTTMSSMSSIVEIGHMPLSSLSLILRHVPHASKMPLLFLNAPIILCTSNLLPLRHSHSTPFPSRNIFTVWSLLRASTPNLNAFQTVSGSF